MKFTETAVFTKECKRLCKKYKTINDDLSLLKTIITDTPMGDGTRHWNGLHTGDGFKLFKLRMMCRSVNGKKFRVVYAYHDGTNTVEFVDFIEIYFKGNKDNEDKGRVSEYIKERE